MRALGGSLAWAWLAVLLLLLVVHLAGASHVVYEEEKLEVEAAAVPPSIVHPLLRTGYHFQALFGWAFGFGFWP